MRRLAFSLVAFAVWALATDAFAQQQPPPPGLPTPRINNVFPGGAKAGTSVEVSITGFDLDAPTGLLFSHPGIKGEYLPPKAPEADPKKKDPPPKAAAIPPTGPFKFKVTVDAATPLGNYDLRVVNKWGVSNPRAFTVGEFVELLEKEPNNDVPEAQKVEIGTTVNGVISAGTDVDYTQFAGKKGQRVLIACRASSLDSKVKPMIEVYSTAGRKLALNRNYREADALADVTLPEDGDYLVRLFEFTYLAGGVDFGYRLSINTAPWIDAVYPPAIEAGKATPVTLYGRNLPGGTPSGFFIDGKPLDKATVTITPPADPLAAQRLVIRDRVEPATALQDGFEYSIKGPGGTSNGVPVYFTREKLVVKKSEGGTKPDAPEAIAAPCEVGAMIHKKGERDWYSFEAKKGDVLYVEVTAERNGRAADFYFNVYSPADPKTPMSKMSDLSGEIDDETDNQNINLHPTEFYNRSGDPPPYKFTAPADGKFLIAVGCRESTFLFGPSTMYRLRVGPAKPDFRAIVKPYAKSYHTGSSARQDGTEALEVFIHRMDGFNGPITLTAEGLPAGVTAKPTVIGPGAKWGTLVLNVGPSAAVFSGAITVKATATLPTGAALVREARPSSVVWGTQPGQNIPVVSRLSQTLVLSVRPEKGFFKVTADPAAAIIKPPMGKEDKVTGPIVVKQGDKLTLPVKASWIGAEKPNVTLVPEPMMQNPQQAPITMAVAAQPTMAKPDVVVNIDVKSTAPPGVYSVVLRGDSQVGFTRDPMAAKPAKTNVPASAFTDPVEITVLPTSVAKFTAGPIPNNVIKAGTTVEAPIKIDRQYGFAGEFKVKFVPPMGVTGVTAEEVTVPAGKDEAKLTFKAAADAKPGAVAGTITVTAIYDKKYPITHETKVSFTVAPADKKK